MNSISKLSDHELLNKIKTLVSEEKRITQEVLDHLEEIEYRRLYLEKGYPSLFMYCVEELKYSESSAHRRISAMRVIRKIPQAKESLERGSVNLSTLTQLHSFLRKEEKEKSYTQEMKLEILEKISGKSQKECELELIKISPLEVRFAEKEKVLTEDLTQMAFVANRELKAKFDLIRNLTAHKNSNPTLTELLDFMADIVITKLNPIDKTDKISKLKVNKTKGAENESSLKFQDEKFVLARAKNITSAAEVMPQKKGHSDKNVESSTTPEKRQSHSLYIPASLQKYIWKRDHGCCQYTDKETKKKCEGKFALQIDHIHPFSLGGNNQKENLRLLCRAHNDWRTKDLYGQ